MNRVPPHDLNAERAVLGAILLQNSHFDLTSEFVKREDFYSEANAILFETMGELHKRSQPIDSVTLGEALDRAGKLRAVGGHEYLLALTDTIPEVMNTKAHAQIIGDKATARRLIEAANAIASRGYGDYGPITEYSDWAEREIFQVCMKQLRKRDLTLRELTMKVFEAIEEAGKSGSRISGLTTGFTQLDALTAGMHPGQLIIVAGRPGMGKTSFALNVALNAAHSRKGTGRPAWATVFSLEMSGKDLTERLLSSEGRVDSQRMRQGKLYADDWPTLAIAAGELSDMPVSIDDTEALSLVELRSKARRIHSERGLCLLVVDYLQLMRSGSKNDSREQEISEISRGLKALAKELEIPIIALSQLNRAVENRSDKRPQLSDLRESGAIEQDADTIWFVYRDEKYNQNSPDQGIAEVIVGKQRAGATGTVRLRFTGEYTRFDNLSEQEQQEEI